MEGNGRRGAEERQQSGEGSSCCGGTVQEGSGAAKPGLPARVQSPQVAMLTRQQPGFQPLKVLLTRMNVEGTYMSEEEQTHALPCFKGSRNASFETALL